MTRRAQILATLVLALLAACSKRVTAPEPPTAPRGPEIVAVHPEAGATRVSDEPEIWAEFSAPLDSATVTTRTVVLMLDTQRIPSLVRWDVASRRIHVRPLEPLALSRTHTVLLEPGIRTEAGGEWAAGTFWQFKTAGIAAPRHSHPVDGARDESPFVTLFWDSCRVAPGVVRYLVYAAEDSEAVSRRTVPALASTNLPRLLPEDRWRLGTTLYWAITAVNNGTGEQARGPVWRFQTLPVSTPTLTVTLPPTDWGHYDGTLSEQDCYGVTFSIGDGRYSAAIRWDLRPLGPLKLAGVEMFLSPVTSGSILPFTLYTAREDWRACDIRSGGPPGLGEPIGAFARVGQGDFRLANTALATFVEAMTRYPGFHGFVPSGGANVAFSAHQSSLVIRYYVTPAVPRGADSR